MMIALCLVAGLFPASAHATGATTFVPPNDPEFSKQWTFKPFTYYESTYPYTYIDKAWTLMPAGAQKLRVAVLDNGFDIDHPDLKANINQSLAYNIYLQNNDVSPTTASASDHGTHVAGIFGAVANNGIGIAGIANNYAEIVPVKTVSRDANGDRGVTLGETAAGIDYAVAQGCKVINISNGTYYSSGSRHAGLDRAIADATSQGVVIVAAAGNGNSSDLMFPSDHASVISVTSTSKAGTKTNYSDHNQSKDIAAPGGSATSEYTIADAIYSTVNGGSYGYKNGTSMAAPFVTGVVALMFASNPNLTVDQVKNILYTTATDIGDQGFDEYFGHGLVNAEACVREAVKLNPSAGTGGNNGGGTGNPGGSTGGNPGGNPGGSTGGAGGAGNPGGNPGGSTGGSTGGSGNPGNPGGGTGGTGSTGDTGGTGVPGNPNNPGTGTPGFSNNPDPGNGDTNTGAGNNSDSSIAPGQSPASYTVKFIANGGKKLKGTRAKKTVVSGKKYGKLPVSKRSGYKFVGWYTKKTGGKKITTKTTVKTTRNQKLYAHWKRKS